MTFADVPSAFGARFECGWSDRPEAAADIAERVCRLAKQLGEVDPQFRRIRPDPGMRKFRAGDRGPILDMPRAELVELVERRGRFDPPRFPAPVSPQGYSILFRNDLMGLEPSFLSIKVSAGAFEYGANENRVWVWPGADHSLWREPERGIEVLEAMVRSWDAEWACAYTIPLEPFVERRETSTPIRPWLAWTARPLQPRPKPPYRRAYPYPFPLDHAGPPAEVRSWHSGELQIWP